MEHLKREYAVGIYELFSDVDHALEVVFRRVGRLCRCSPSIEPLSDEHIVVQAQVIRMLHLLLAAWPAGNEGYGVAVGSLVRTMMETLIDTAWMLRDLPTRSALFGRFAILEEWAALDALNTYQGWLSPVDKATLDRWSTYVSNNPRDFDTWRTKHGALKSPHSRRWSGISVSEMCKNLGSEYEDLYNLDYLTLSSTIHGSGLVAWELQQGAYQLFVERLPMMLAVATDQHLAAIRFLLGLRLCVSLVREVQNTLVGHETLLNKRLARRIDELATKVSNMRFRQPIQLDRTT